MIEMETIPASIRKPGAYLEFNTRLAVRTLPANAQKLCLIVPLEEGATAAADQPIQFYDAAEARKLWGKTAQAMAEAAITSYRYLQIWGVGVATASAAEPNIDTFKTALDATAAGEFTLLVPAWNSAAVLTALRDHIEQYTDSINQQSIIGVTASTTTITDATALASALNCGAITLALLPGVNAAPAVVAAAYAAVIASEQDPARPLNTLTLDGIDIPPMDKQLSRNEQETCLLNGITPLEVGPGDKIQIVRAVTTYTKNAAGADDIALLDITTMRTLYYLRKACRDRIRLRFPREKLNERIKGKVWSELYDVLKKCEELEFIEAVEENKAGLIVERSLQDPNRLDAAIPSDVVNGLHIFAGRIDLLL